MALLGVSLRAGRIECAATPAVPVSDALAGALAHLPCAAPVVILIHGYKYTPERVQDDPHRLIFAMDPACSHWKIKSWPRGLGFTAGGLSDGLCIGFAWPATVPAPPPGGVAGIGGGFARVYGQAAAAGAALAGLIDSIGRLAPGRRVDIVAHSLGARVALQALPALREGVVARMILMGAAEFAGRARDCLGAARTKPEVYNITSRANNVFDLLFHCVAPRDGVGCGRALGRGLDNPPAAWVDLDLDAPATAGLVARRGIDLAPRSGAFCHWGFYLRPGALPLYRAVLRDRAAWHPADLRREAALTTPAPVRFFPRFPTLPPPAGTTRQA